MIGFLQTQNILEIYMLQTKHDLIALALKNYVLRVDKNG